MIAIVSIERHMAAICVFSIFVNKLSYWQQLSSIDLFVIDKSLKVDLCHIVLPFGLTIYLYIKISKEFLLNL